MSPKNKLTALLAIAITVWQVSLIENEKMTLACSFVLIQPCKKPDKARTTFYVMAAVSALGIAMRPLPKKEKPQTTQKPRPHITYGGKQ